MTEFLEFFDKKRRTFPMHLEITYNKTCDWGVCIYKKGCASDYPTATHSGEDVIICSIDGCDLHLAFAKAQVKLKEWLSEYEGGY